MANSRPSDSGGAARGAAIEPTDRRDFDAERLMAEHRPRWRDANKQTVFDIACPAGAAHPGTVGFTRWPTLALPDRIATPDTDSLVVSRLGYFDYAPLETGDATVEWHLNFADPDVFAFFAGGLFAQDEMQVAEHPILGALRQALVASGAPTRTTEGGVATPILVTGAIRCCSIDTTSLYGNAFSRADTETVVEATTRLDPPTTSNILAIAAIAGGRGTYRADEIRTTLMTAYSGFEAAVAESARLAAGMPTVVVHTGYWGCGAFGGNRVLMAILQVLAASMAGLDRLVFHTGGTGGDQPLAEAISTLDQVFGGSPDLATTEVIAQIESLGLLWGVSDGN